MLAAILLLAPPDPLTFERRYSVGERDRYETVITVSGQLTGTYRTITQLTVKKVYPDGSADVETKVESASGEVMGQTQNIPLPRPSTARLDKYGVDIKAKKGGAGLPNFARYAALAGKAVLAVGDSVPVEEKLEDATVSGRFTLAEVKEGQALLRGDLTVLAKAAPAPYALQIETRLDATNGKPLRTVAIATGLPQTPNAPQVDRIEFTVVRL